MLPDIQNTQINPSEKREIGDEAVWSLSTAKPGNGVEQLRDDNTDTYVWDEPNGCYVPRLMVYDMCHLVINHHYRYWQSDGSQPHLINIQFHKKMSIAEVSFFLDYKLDESYTPKKMSLRAGTTFHDLEEVYLLELKEPNGWVFVPVGKMVNQGGLGVLRAHFLQIEVLGMHQNGRDTHIRQVKVYGPRQLSSHRMLQTTAQGGAFKTPEFLQFSCIR